MVGGEPSNTGHLQPKDRQWRMRDYVGITPTVFSGVFLTEDTVQGVGDSASVRRTRKLWLLPRCGYSCLCRAAQNEVRILIINIVAASSPRRDSNPQIVVYLRTLSSGDSHPSAQCSTIEYFPKGHTDDIPSVSISSSRLAVLANMGMVIWDWKTSQVLFVCQSFGA